MLLIFSTEEAAASLHRPYIKKALQEASATVNQTFQSWTNRYFVQNPKIELIDSTIVLGYHPEDAFQDVEVFVSYKNHEGKAIRKKLMVIDASQLMEDARLKRRYLIDSIIERTLYSDSGIANFLRHRQNLQSKTFSVPQVFPCLDQLGFVFKPLPETRGDFKEMLGQVVPAFFDQLSEHVRSTSTVAQGVVSTEIRWQSERKTKARSISLGITIEELVDLKIQFGMGFVATETLWFTAEDLAQEDAERQMTIVKKLRQMVDRMATVNPSKLEALGLRTSLGRGPTSCQNQLESSE